MDACSDYNIKEVVVMAGAQLGKSEALLNIIGYHIDHDPMPDSDATAYRVYGSVVLKGSYC